MTLINFACHLKKGVSIISMNIWTAGIVLIKQQLFPKEEEFYSSLNIEHMTNKDHKLDIYA